MFRSLMTIIRELYLYLTKVIFMLKTLGKITSLYKLGDVAACRRVACVLFAVQSETEFHSAQHTTQSSGPSLTLHSTQHSPQDSVSLCTAHNTVLRTRCHSAQHTTQSSGIILTLHRTHGD